MNRVFIKCGVAIAKEPFISVFAADAALERNLGAVFSYPGNGRRKAVGFAGIDHVWQPNGANASDAAHPKGYAIGHKITGIGI